MPNLKEPADKIIVAKEKSLHFIAPVINKLMKNAVIKFF